MKEFYSRLTGKPIQFMEDIPREALEFMAGMEYVDLVRPIVLHGLRGGVPIRTLSAVYGISRIMVRNIKRKFLVGDGTQGYPEASTKEEKE